MCIENQENKSGVGFVRLSSTLDNGLCGGGVRFLSIIAFWFSVPGVGQALTHLAHLDLPLPFFKVSKVKKLEASVCFISTEQSSGGENKY